MPEIAIIPGIKISTMDCEELLTIYCG